MASWPQWTWDEAEHHGRRSLLTLGQLGRERRGHGSWGRDAPFQGARQTPPSPAGPHRLWFPPLPHNAIKCDPFRGPIHLRGQNPQDPVTFLNTHLSRSCSGDQGFSTWAWGVDEDRQWRVGKGQRRLTRGQARGQPCQQPQGAKTAPASRKGRQSPSC